MEKTLYEQNIYSKISGRNIYRIADVTDGVYVLKDIATGDLFNASAVSVSSENSDESYSAWLGGIVSDPVISAVTEWPVDVVEITENGVHNVCYVYIRRDLSGFKPIRELLYQTHMTNTLDWRLPLIAKICKNLASAIALMHRNKYLYCSFDVNSIMYNPDDGRVFLRFTNFVRCIAGSSEHDEIDCNEVAFEFAPPFIYDLAVYKGNMTVWTDMFQLTALLFKLMIGKLPYEGRDLSDYGVPFDLNFDKDAGSHKHYFDHYHKFPHFIFDEKDRTNRLSDTTDNNTYRERWAALPGSVKKMFSDILCQHSAESGKCIKDYLPKHWVDEINLFDSQTTQNKVEESKNE